MDKYKFKFVFDNRTKFVITSFVDDIKSTIDDILSGFQYHNVLALSTADKEKDIMIASYNTISSIIIQKVVLLDDNNYINDDKYKLLIIHKNGIKTYFTPKYSKDSTIELILQSMSKEGIILLEDVNDGFLVLNSVKISNIFVLDTTDVELYKKRVKRYVS